LLTLAPQEREAERVAQEQAEKETAENEKKLQDAFSDIKTQWEKDKAELQNIKKHEEDPLGIADESQESAIQVTRKDSDPDATQESLQDVEQAVQGDATQAAGSPLDGV
jgi:hypothetical protein